MQSSCYFIFSHSVLLCPSLYSINIHNSHRTRSILILVLSTAEPLWTSLPIVEKSKSHCDWRSENQSVLVSSPIWGSRPDIYYCLTVTVLFFCGASSPMRKRVCLLYMLLALASAVFLIFYCLRFETSLFVASYDSQGHGEGIQPCLHTGISFSCKRTRVI
jgi:hypothetical protein